jgi:hypothetical protein
MNGENIVNMTECYFIQHHITMRCEMHVYSVNLLGEAGHEVCQRPSPPPPQGNNYI